MIQRRACRKCGPNMSKHLLNTRLARKLAVSFLIQKHMEGWLKRHTSCFFFLNWCKSYITLYYICKYLPKNTYIIYIYIYIIKCLCCLPCESLCWSLHWFVYRNMHASIKNTYQIMIIARTVEVNTPSLTRYRKSWPPVDSPQCMRPVAVSIRCGNFATSPSHPPHPVGFHEV
jgi:hypothetical protein